MMQLKYLRGMRFPDEYLIRFFFKQRHNHRTGRVLELGCGNGNNLALYHAFGWDITGVDINAQSLTDAAYNFEGQGCFIQHDLSEGLPKLDRAFDVLLIPNVLYYLPSISAHQCLKRLTTLCTEHCQFFLRTRLRDDYRYGRGREVEQHGFTLDTPETGEAGLLNVFYTEYEIITLLTNALGANPQTLTILHCCFDNIQSGQLVTHNSDLVVWGTVQL